MAVTATEQLASGSTSTVADAVAVCPAPVAFAVIVYLPVAENLTAVEGPVVFEKVAVPGPAATHAIVRLFAEQAPVRVADKLSDAELDRNTC